MTMPEKGAKPRSEPDRGGKPGLKAVKRSPPAPSKAEQQARCTEAERQIVLINRAIAAIRKKGYPGGAKLVDRLKITLDVHHKVLDEAAKSGLYGRLTTESGVVEKLRTKKQYGNFRLKYI